MPIPEPSPLPVAGARHCPRCDVEGGSTILLTNPFLGKAFPMRTAANATSLPLTSLSQKSPESPGACMQFARNNHICGGVYGIKDSQLGDGPMNLPLELQRRLDRRWSARFGMSKQRSRPAPCAAMARTVVKAQAPAVRAGQPALEHSAPASCSTRRLVI